MNIVLINISSVGKGEIQMIDKLTSDFVYIKSNGSIRLLYSDVSL